MCLTVELVFPEEEATLFRCLPRILLSIGSLNFVSNTGWVTKVENIFKIKIFQKK